MDKDLMGEKFQSEDNKKDFKNEFVESSKNNISMQKQQAYARQTARNESDSEPNGMDLETIFEKGLSFQESPEEYFSQRMNHFEKEPNSINRKDR
ncbi:hypothetical protein M3193_03400 [Sporosarcina luteola]|uniref:hypothetical protein n=1 Tax=Sporosarcina luteola TaxID=582850 RepID=UPI00204169DD|nr:hypothetical protein [Sporosarcina luteola]MCM3743178.1 hypothetical protein [Sporosarcina luteola]